MEIFRSKRGGSTLPPASRAVFGFHATRRHTNPTPGQLQRRIRSQSSGYRCDVRLVIAPRTLRVLRTTLWITSGWIGAALLVHWIVRRVPTYPARELTAVATGAVIGLGSAWFELKLIPRLVRSLTVGGLLLARTFFYVTLCAVTIHTVTASLLGLSEHGGLFAYYTSGQYHGRPILAGANDPHSGELPHQLLPAAQPDARPGHAGEPPAWEVSPSRRRGAHLHVPRSQQLHRDRDGVGTSALQRLQE